MSSPTALSLSQRFAVPADPILLIPDPGSATVEDVIPIQDHEGIICELIEGTLVRKTMGFLESALGIFLAQLFGEFVDTRNLGIVTGAGGAFELIPHLVRIPDVAFISWDASPADVTPPNRYPRLRRTLPSRC